MELRTVRYFVATVDAGSVSAAAAAVRVTQPALSRQLRQLERELGVDLFERSGGRLTLSPIGRALLPLARELLDRADALRLAATLHASGRLERITIGAPATTLADVVAPFITTLTAGDPTPAILTADRLTTTETLAIGAELAIGTATVRPPYRALPLAVLPVWAYVPPAHPWAGRTAVSLGELLEQPLVVPPETFTAREALDTAVAAAGLTYADLTEASDGTVAQALAAAGRGVAVVSDDPRFKLTPTAILADSSPPRVRLLAAWDTRHPAAGTLAAIAARLARYIVDRYGPDTAPATTRAPREQTKVRRGEHGPAVRSPFATPETD
ncbi:DNA-binding transcriptional regulator, LysR family [Parafrankia irregularis]|uniref:DNA-binding transcriptional regulator, LysR family n=2 Tax=Frankiaceae TaxID=74712 RepID=A0A0S4QGY2_9ACTN|nr:LysR family transcriptional regulator [Parafrankia sp. CH37]CUU53894.1 DNA-binding transcriptional regulator, LysR family [Parafrankia irregularis]